MRPTVRFLTDDLIRRIVSEAVGLLSSLGMRMENAEMRSLLADHGAQVDGGRVCFTETMVEKALETVPRAFQLYDAHGNQTHDFAEGNVHYTPGSAALMILDRESGLERKPVTQDYVDYAKVVGQLDHIASQSTALIPSEVHEGMSDSYRLFLSLLYGSKPVVTGTFKAESFQVMKDLQVAVRGDEQELAEKPLTIFTCCPTTPLEWSDMGARNVADCVGSGIPIEVVPFVMSGFNAPVTLVGSLVQHTAEVLSGVVMAQAVRPGAPLLCGSSSTPFDVRFQTAPLGAVETWMFDCAFTEVGHHLGMPTQAYISVSDAKLLDSQAGLESGIGNTLAALAGINNVSGPGMLDMESCQSLEKLVLDNEICGMAQRMARGIEPKEDFPILPRMEELLAERHLLIADHSRRYLREEQYFPGPTIDRTNRARWEEDGSVTLGQRAHGQVEALLASWEPPGLPDSVQQDLTKLMEGEARRVGQDDLPERPT